jgi:hypothetical protein
MKTNGQDIGTIGELTNGQNILPKESFETQSQIEKKPHLSMEG